MVPPRTDRERLDDRRKLVTRGRDPTVRNQVRVRVDGGKTAAKNERLLRAFAGAYVEILVTLFLAGHGGGEAQQE